MHLALDLVVQSRHRSIDLAKKAGWAVKVILLVITLSMGPSLWTSAAAQQGDVEVFIARATLAYEDKQYDDALAILNTIQELDPGNSRALYYLGLVHLAQHNPRLAVQSLEAARQQRPTHLFIRFQLGVAYFALEDYDRANQLLTEVYAEQPQLENLGFYVGFLRYREKKYTEALAAFSGTEALDPKIQQLTLFYRGLALAVLNLPEQATAELDEALKIETVSPVTGAAIRLRNAVGAGRIRKPEKRLRAQVSVGGFYDDNVAINPDASDDPVAEFLRSRDTTAPGLLTSGFLDYSWLRTEAWEATVNYSFFQTLNLDEDLSRFNIQNHRVGMNGFYRNVIADLPFQLALGYAYDYLFLDEDGFLSRNTVTSSASVVEPSFSLPFLGDVGNLTTGVVRYQVKEFFQEVGDDDPRFGQDIRDAFNIMAGFGHVFRLSQDQHLLRIGYQYDNENADGVNFSYKGHRVLTGGLVTLPWGDIRLRYDYDLHFRAYDDGNNTLFPLAAPNTVERDDTQQTHVAQIEKDLPYDLTLAAQFQRIMNRSSVEVYDYTKSVFSVILSWTY